MRVAPLGVVLLLAQPALAGKQEKLPGTWKLSSFLLEDVATKERKPVYGEHPKGFLVLTPDRRLISVVTGEGRTAPRTDADQAAAFRSMLAYAGRYRIEGDKFITEVDVAWDEAWIGAEQVRFYRLEGDKLYIETAPQLSIGFDGRMARGIVTWERER